MMSNKGLNSKEALDESTATNSLVTLSGIRREKEAPTDLDIEEYSRNPGNSHRGLRGQRSQVSGQLGSCGLRRVAQERVEIQWVRGHCDGTVGVARPFLFWTIAVKLDSVLVRIVEIKCLT